MNNKTGARTIEVYTDDVYLFQKIRLSAPEGATVTRGKSDAESPIRLVDIDGAHELPDGEYKSMSRADAGADIPIPFPLDMLERLLSAAATPIPLTISEDERAAYLNGERIKLTDVEYRLLSELILAGGEYKSREELLRGVWDNDTDPGVLNVYVHYLREKLEACGEKIILSSRKCGYRISEKYTGGGM